MTVTAGQPPDRITQELAILVRVAEPEDSEDRLRAKLAAEGHVLGEATMHRRIAAMRRQLGDDTADRSELRTPRRRAGYVVLRWRRRCL